MSVALSKASGAMGIFDIAYGYLIAHLILQTFPEMGFEQQIAISIIFGGFIAGFLFYIAPIEDLMKYLYRHYFIRKRSKKDKEDFIPNYSIAYDSSYLINSKTKIASALYLFIFSMVFIFFTPPSLKGITYQGLNVAQIIAFAVGMSILTRAVWEIGHLPMKIRIVLKFVDMLKMGSSHNILDSISRELENGNWGQVNIMLDGLKNIIGMRDLIPGLMELSRILKLAKSCYEKADRVHYWLYIMNFKKAYYDFILYRALEEKFGNQAPELYSILSEIYRKTTGYFSEYEIITNTVTQSRDHNLNKLREKVFDDKDLINEIQKAIYEMDQLNKLM